MNAQAFSVEDGYDAAHANRAGGSRYFDYIADRSSSFDACWDWDEVSAARFAATAWQIATTPIMAPGYVRTGPRVLGAALERSDWDGGLVACVDLITPAPAGLRAALERDGGTWWRDWPAESLLGHEAYCYPSGQDLSESPYILPSVSLRFPIPADRVPAPPANRPTLTELQHAARRCVVALAAELNRTVDPAITALGRS